ncbi:MAG: ATP-binding protein [bacterium]|nr:ATP-binding protein [bacterium]
MKPIFEFGKPVIGRELIGREKEVTSLLAYALGGQSVILSAPRRFGKTSILLEVLRRAREEGFAVGYLDIFEAVSLRELSEKIVETLLANDKLSARRFLSLLKKDIKQAVSMLEFKTVLSDYEFILSFSSQETEEVGLFDDTLNFIEEYGRKKKGRLIFVIDEFSDLVKWNSRLLKKMRSKFQRHQNVTYLFAGSHESMMKDIFTKKSFAFYGFGLMMELEPIPERELTEYLYSNFIKAGFEVSRETVSFMVSRTSSHPHYTKILAQQIVDLTSEEKKIDQDAVDEAFQIALLGVKGELDKEWEDLAKAPLQRKIIKILANEKGLPYRSKNLREKEKRQLYFALTELEKKGIIRKGGKGRYVFYNPFFEGYIELLDKGARA